MHARMDDESSEKLHLVKNEASSSEDKEKYSEIELTRASGETEQDHLLQCKGTQETEVHEQCVDLEDEHSDCEDTSLRQPTGDTDNEELSSSDSLEPPVAAVSVYISKQDGEIRKEDAIVPGADGSVVIVTPAPEPWEQDRSIRPRDLQLLYAFSVVAIVLFFPTGIAAVIYAKKTSRAFYQGLEIGNLEDARNFSKTSERLIISSIVCGLICVVLVLSVIEKAALAEANTEVDTPRFLHGLH